MTGSASSIPSSIRTSRNSLGTYVIMDHVALAREAGLPYVYLGYWVPGSDKMGYKAQFEGLEVYLGGEWQSARRSGGVFQPGPSPVDRPDRAAGGADQPARPARRGLSDDARHVPRSRL
jgi:hypothetical protein